MLLTVARGSSDAAALWLRALADTEVGWPTGSLAPPTISIYDADVRLDEALVVLISQSGGPDLLAVAEHARARGALTVGMVDEAAAPPASAVRITLSLGAGPEPSIAATKTCLSAFAPSTALVDACQPEPAGGAADLPVHLARSTALDRASMADFLSSTPSAFVVARGPSLAVATEVALQFKEVTGMHAKAVSAAELIGGPLALAGTPALRAMGALQAFYMALPAVARRRGRDPDASPGLKKVTSTL